MIVVSGKSRLAVECLGIILERQVAPGQDLRVLLAQSDLPEDGWQPSLRKAATKHGLEIITPDQLPSCRGIFFSLEYDRIVVPRLLQFERLFNVHFSLLPAYKGCWTSLLPILHGQKHSGVTLHVIDEGIDTGPIVDQTRIGLADMETSFTLYEKYIDAGVELFARNLETLVGAGAVKTTPQPPLGSTYFSRAFVDPEKVEIDVRSTWTQIDRFVRALHFPVYQVSTFKGLPVLRAEFLRMQPGAKCGLTSRVQGEYSDVQCIDALVRLWHRAA